MLQSNGITTFSQLAETDANKIDQILEEGGPRYRFAQDLIKTWPEQAQLAAANKWDELKELQEKVKNKAS